jgi:putative transposase
MSGEHITRRRLPHWYVPETACFVTFRLANTLPQPVILELRDRRESLLRSKPRSEHTPEFQDRVHKQVFAAYDDWLDRLTDVAWLGDPRIAAIVRQNLYFHDQTSFRLLSYCVMPNHVHVLFQPHGFKSPAPQHEAGHETHSVQSPLTQVMHSIKSYTAHEANKLLCRHGPFWQRESYDHWVRDEGELERIVGYIQHNPVKARLVSQPQDWVYSSCHDRYLIDGDLSGLLGYR